MDGTDRHRGIFSENTSGATIIDFQRFFVQVTTTPHTFTFALAREHPLIIHQIRQTKYDARINHILPKLVSVFQSHAPLPQFPTSPLGSISLPTNTPTPIEHDWLWDRLSSFLRPTDLVITETGTCQGGITATRFPHGAHGWTQGIYGSIGYAAGAAAGASVASKETGLYNRVVLVTGEGSLQLTVQAFSLLNRLGVPPVVFILNNKGYTIERYFNGWEAAYNDIPMWDYGALAKGFAPEVEVEGYKVGTAEELDRLLSDDEGFGNSTKPRIVDMVMGVDDAPTGLKMVFREKERRRAAAATAAH